MSISQNSFANGLLTINHTEDRLSINLCLVSDSKTSHLLLDTHKATLRESVGTRLQQIVHSNTD